MFPNITTGVTRPDRLVKPNQKKEEYHADYARWALGDHNQTLHYNYVLKCAVNWGFYKGRQWLYNEDIENFLMDENGNSRNRISLVENLIRPMVNQYVGNAIRTDLEFEAKNISPFAITKREKSMDKLRFAFEFAEQIPETQSALMENLPLMDTEEETIGLFQNTFVDETEDNINKLVRYVAEMNNQEELKKVCARNLAVCGMSIVKGFDYNREWCQEATDPMYFFWDKGARKSDLSDAGYMGEYSFMQPSEIYERYGKNLKKGQMEAIENYAKNENSNKNFGGTYDIYNYIMSTRGRVPVYEVYWRDTEEQEFGFVDEFGFEYFTRVNDGGKYSDKDLIKPKDPDNIKYMGGKGVKKRKIYVDVLRYCVFIPNEIVGGTDSDIILEFGEMPYQKRDTYTYSSVDYPYNVYCWEYHNGEVLSPIDDAIDPQRFVNRVLSVAENQINNSSGSNLIYDSDIVDAQEGEDGMIRDMHASRPVKVSAKGRPLSTAIQPYNNQIGTGTTVLFDIANTMSTIIQNVTGVNEAMQGTGGGSKDLVGVKQLQIQRGTIMQEQFYFALSQVFLQAANQTASSGKRMYVRNKRKLAIITGDAGAEHISLTEDYELQDYRLFVKRVTSKEDQITSGNEYLFTLLQAQLIDKDFFADCFNRSSVDDIAKKYRAFISTRMAAEQEMAQGEDEAAMMQAGAQAEMMQQQKAEQEEFRGRELEDKAIETEGELAKIDARTDGQIRKKQMDKAMERGLI